MTMARPLDLIGPEEAGTARTAAEAPTRNRIEAAETTEMQIPPILRDGLFVLISLMFVAGVVFGPKWAGWNSRKHVWFSCGMLLLAAFALLALAAQH